LRGIQGYQNKNQTQNDQSFQKKMKNVPLISTGLAEFELFNGLLHSSDY